MTTDTETRLKEIRAACDDQQRRGFTGTTLHGDDVEWLLAKLEASRKALREIARDTACRCDEAYTARGRCEPNSFCYLEDVAKAALAADDEQGQEAKLGGAERTGPTGYESAQRPNTAPPSSPPCLDWRDGSTHCGLPRGHDGAHSWDSPPRSADDADRIVDGLMAKAQRGLVTTPMVPQSAVLSAEDVSNYRPRERRWDELPPHFERLAYGVLCRLCDSHEVLRRERDDIQKEWLHVRARLIQAEQALRGILEPTELPAPQALWKVRNYVRDYFVSTKEQSSTSAEYDGSKCEKSTNVEGSKK